VDGEFMMISTRLKLTVYLCLWLMFGISVSLYKAYDYQEFIYTQLYQVMKIQLSVDNLRSQLWVYQEYTDDLSLNELNRRQAELARNLSTPMDWNIKQKRLLGNLNRLNTNTRAFINTQLPFSRQKDDAESNNIKNMIVTNEATENLASNNVDPTNSAGDSKSLPHVNILYEPTYKLLQAKYSMIIQEMTEDVFSLHQMTIKRAKTIQFNLILVSGIILLLLSLLVTGFSHWTLKRFKGAIKSLTSGVKKLAKGDMHSKVVIKQRDEFTALAKEFNSMKECLQGMTIKKEELTREVGKQTKILTEQQVKLKFLAEHDELTGIFNRRALLKQIDIAIARANRSQTHAALLFIDLNGFKMINDTLGHDVGDQVITVIAKRLHDSLRNTDIVGRLGGDEFIVWLDVIEDKQFVIQKIKQLSALVMSPIDLAGHKLTVGASIGVSLLFTDGNTSELLIKTADVAMYQAKEHSETNYYFFSDIQ
jgi:diguanylate cyclase (GGDEF)-like protein